MRMVEGGSGEANWGQLNPHVLKTPRITHLGGIEQSLGVRDYVLLLLDRVDAGLDGLGVLFTGRVEDVLNFL